MTILKSKSGTKYERVTEPFEYNGVEYQMLHMLTTVDTGVVIPESYVGYCKHNPRQRIALRFMWSRHPHARVFQLVDVDTYKAVEPSVYFTDEDSDANPAPLRIITD